MKEEVDTEAVKERIAKGSKEAANPKHSRKDVEALHNKRREEVKKMVKEEVKAKNKGSVRSTVLPKSRERDIGRHDDWKDPHPDTQDFGQDSPAKQKLKRRMIAVIGTRRREDKEAGLRKEDSDLILSYLLDNGYALDEHSAKNIMEAMSEQWIHFILDEEVH
jgi:hypothetical protein